MFQIINSVFNSITYILPIGNKKECFLVDCGDIDKVIAQGWKIHGVLLTHSHFDHIYGLPKLLNIFPNCKIITNHYGKEALADDKLNLSKFHNDSVIVKSNNVVCCKDGDVIELFDKVKINVYETPGHNPSCLTYLCDEYIFTGDSYIPGIKVVTNLPKGNKIQAEESVEKIKNIIGTRTICPGHGEISKFE